MSLRRASRQNCKGFLGGYTFVFLCVAMGLGLILTACPSTPTIPDEKEVEKLNNNQVFNNANSDKIVENKSGPDVGVPVKITPPVKVKLTPEQIVEATEAAVTNAENGEYESARRKLSELSEEHPEDHLVLYNLAIVEERLEKSKEAEAHYLASLIANPDFSPALENYLRLKIRTDDVREVENQIRKYIGSRPENFGHKNVLLAWYLYEGKYEQVIADARSILTQDEINADAMMKMALAYWHLGKPDLAELVFKRAEELSPDNSEIDYYLAHIYLEKKNIHYGMQKLRDAIKKRPDFAEAHNDLGVLYHQARDYKNAVSEFELAIESASDFKEAYLNKGNSLKGAFDTAGAEESFKMALSVDPNYPEVFFNLGALYLDREITDMDTVVRLEKAISYFGEYKVKMGSKKIKNDPVDKYIDEATKLIEVEKERISVEEEMEKEAEEIDDYGDGEEGEDSGDDSTDEYDDYSEEGTGEDGDDSDYDEYTDDENPKVTDSDSNTPKPVEDLPEETLDSDTDDSDYDDSDYDDTEDYDYGDSDDGPGDYDDEVQ